MDEEQARQAYFEKGRASNAQFWQRFGEVPDWAGKRVLDLGSGHGALAVELAAAGADVVGVDLNGELVEFADRHTRREFAHLRDRLSFLQIDLADLPGDEPFDVVVTKDTLEHVDDIDAVLADVRRLLVPGGRLYAGFSPLYFSPFGDHARTGLRLPWAHAVLPERAVLAVATRRTGQPVRSLADLGLNGNTPDRFRRAFRDSGMRVVRIDYNRGDKRLLGPLETLRGRVPRLERFTTVSMYAVLAS